MRLPTQILLLGAILTNGARAALNASDAAPVAPAPENVVPPASEAEKVVQLEPVRVTADLWETPLEKIPASVSVYDGAALRSSGVRHFGDLAGQVPNLTYTGGSSRPRYFQIRGIGENSQFEGETPDSSVAFKLDDLDFTGLGGVGSSFDVRQIEVLRGPQAGAFGANAAGGLVQIVTNSPTPYTTGFVEGSVGSDNLREVGAAAGGSLTPATPEKLMFRVAAQHSQSDGFRRNATLGRDTNARDEDFMRLKLTWNPNRLWSWDATLFYADLENGYDEFALDNNGERTFSDQPGRDLQESVAGALRGVYSGNESATFTTVTSVSGTDSAYSYDADWTAWRDVPPVNATDGYSGFEDIVRDRTAFSEELRLDSVPEQGGLGFVHRWTLGAFAARTDESTRYTSDYAEAGYAEQTRMNAKYRSDNLALFGQIGHDFDERNRVVLGLRGEGVSQDGSITSVTTGGAPLSFSPDYDDVIAGGKLTLERDFSPGRLAYASVARGYRGGGVNLDRKIVVGTDPLSFETETLWNYEIGVRGRLLESRLNGGLALFYTDRQNTQFRNAVGAGNSYRFFTDNGGDASVYGLEAELDYALAEHLHAFANAATMRSSFESFRYTSGASEQAGDLPNTPDYGFTVGLRYQPPKGFFGRVELVARDDYLESLGHQERRSAHEVVNATLGYAWASWSVSLWARNLLDEEYDKRVFYFANTPATWNAGIASRYTSDADPRQVGLTARYEF